MIIERMMNKIVILGANGYIGQHLAAKLLKLNDVELKLFDIQPESNVFDCEYHQADLTGPLSDVLKLALQSANYLFFFSGLTGTYKSVQSYEQFIHVNELGLLNVLNLLSKNQAKPKLIFPSTRLVYKGQQNKLLKEDDEKEFKTVYAVNKIACENYLKIYQSLFNINYTVFRVCVPYGNMTSRDLSFGTLSHFVNRAAANQNIVLYGDGSLKRTFTHIDDLTNLVIEGAFSPNVINDVYNIGSNDNLSLYKVAEKIAGIYNVKVEFTDFPPVDLAIESGDTILDGTKLTDALNYTYKHSFNDWAMQTIK